MKRVLLTASVVAPLFFAFTHCAVDDGTTTSSGAGSQSATGSGTAGAGGTSTTTTASGTAGSPVTTTSAGTAGSTGSNTGGAGGTGGAGTGDGGAGGAMGGAGGAMGGAGGAMGGAGGAMGGAGGAMGGAGGAMGGAGGGGGVGIDDLAGMKNNFGFAWKDSWFISPCYTKAAADCYTAPGTGCPGTPAGGGFEDSGSLTRETFTLGGTMGAMYAVTFKFNGISEAKVYQNGQYANPMMDPATPMTGFTPTVTEGQTNNVSFYIGGTAVANTYNVMRIRVLGPAVGAAARPEVGRYYMNAYPAGQGWESHRTFALAYIHTIEVPGQGQIEYTTEDSNCRAIDNCGIGDAVTNGACNASRYIPNEPMDLALPAAYGGKQMTTLSVVNGSNVKQPWHAQLSHFTITAVK